MFSTCTKCFGLRYSKFTHNKMLNLFKLAGVVLFYLISRWISNGACKSSPGLGGLGHVDAVNAHLVGDVAQRLHLSLIGLLVVGHLQKGRRVEVRKTARALDRWNIYFTTATAVH